MEKGPKDSCQYTACAGMLAPLLFGTVFTLAGLLRPGYGLLSTYVSELSLKNKRLREEFTGLWMRQNRVTLILLLPWRLSCPVFAAGKGKGLCRN